MTKLPGYTGWFLNSESDNTLPSGGFEPTVLPFLNPNVSADAWNLLCNGGGGASGSMSASSSAAAASVDHVDSADADDTDDTGDRFGPRRPRFRISAASSEGNHSA